MPLRVETVHCTHCGQQHIDKGNWAKKNHTRHLCYICGRFFFTKLGCVGA